jgi:chromosome segregation ATPase
MTVRALIGVGSLLVPLVLGSPPARAATRETLQLQAELAQAKADNAALTAAASAAAAELAKVKAAYIQASDQAHDLASERDRLKLRLDGMTNAATACQAKNGRLVAFAQTLLDDYRKVGLGQVLASREPFLGLSRVKLENIVQDREDTIRANRCNQRLDQAPTPSPATP